MKNYKILEVTDSDGDLYRLNEELDLYENVEDSQDVRSLFEIALGNYGSDIQKVLVIATSKVWSVDDTFTIDGEIQNIEDFTIEKNEVLVNGEYKLSLIQPIVKLNISELQKQIEASYSQPIKLGCKTTPFNHDTSLPLKTFLANFITTYNSDYNTNYVESGRMHTEAGKRRSLGDIYMICKYYYPKCTLYDIIELLYIELPKTLTSLGSLVCGTIHKRVWWNYGSPRFDAGTDEYGYIKDEYIEQLTEYKKSLSNKPKDVTQSIVSTDTLVKVKTMYQPGVKFKTMITNKIVKASSTNFYDGLRNIILIQESGVRNVVFDKTNNKFAEIVK